MNKEKIKAAAIKTINDIVYVGRSHYEIIRDAPPKSCKNGTQGFVTQNNEFLDRKEAKKNAIESNQLSNFDGTLFSEYFWGKDGKYDYDEYLGYYLKEE